MEDTLDAHHDEGLYDLFKNSEDLLNAKLFIFLLVIVQKVAFLAVLHDDFQLFVFLIEVGLVYLD